MFVIESDFKDKYLIRNNTSLPKRITTLTNAVPKEPIYHFMADNEDFGPRPTDLMVHAIVEADENLAVYVHHVTDLPVVDESKYLNKKLTKERDLIQGYHRQYRQFTRVFDLDKTLEKRSPIIVNYQPLQLLYPIRVKRPDTFRTVAMLNHASMLKTAFTLETDRIQFLPINMPRTLKPSNYYRDLANNPRVTELNKIKNREDLILLDLMAYYAGIEDTVFGKYADGAVKVGATQNIVLAFRDDINVFYMSLESLREWREEGDGNRRIEWMYNIFEHLVGLRPAIDLEVDDVYTEKVEEAKAQAKKELEDGEDSVLKNIDKGILAEADGLLESGSITEGEYKGALKLATRYQNLKNPIGDGKLIDVLNERRDITAVPESTIPDMEVIFDKSILSNVVRLTDEKYIKEYLDRDMLRTVMMLQKEGIIITDIRMEEVEDASGKTKILSVQVKPVKGDIGTFKIEYPEVRPDGTFLLGGVKYRMNKQRGDLPIVKLTPQVVALSSSMSKMFVERGRRKTNSYAEWIYTNILNLKELKYIEDLKVGRTFNPDPKLNMPDIYGMMAMRFKSFTFRDFKFAFDYAKREELLKKGETKKLTQLEKSGILVGTHKGEYLFVDESNTFFTTKDGKDEVLGSFDEVIGLDRAKRPIEFAEMKVKGKYVPIGAILAYYMGIDKFFHYIGVRYDEYEPNQRVTDTDGILLRFKDVKLMVKYDTKMQELLVGGLTYFKESLKNLGFEELNSRRGYSAMFSARGIGSGQIAGMTRIERFWVDPITHDILVTMNEPTEIRDLLIRAAELLSNQQHHNENDGDFKIHRGYNRFTDMLYRELITGVNELNRGSTTAKRKFSINPKAVRMAIAMDEGVSPAEESNPMKLTGSQERITYGGAGGRSSQSMMGHHRMFHENDMGVISECFTDNGKAGTILYYSASPAIGNIYGMPKTEGKGKEPGNLFNNSMAILPYLMKDD